MNTDSFQVDDLVDKAQDKNDIPFLVKAVSKRWADHRLGVDKVEGQVWMHVVHVLFLGLGIVGILPIW